MPAENWYYFTLSQDKPFNAVWKDNSLKLHIPHPENLKQPDDLLAVMDLAENSAERNNYPPPVIQRGAQKVDFDDKVIQKRQEKGLYSRLYGYVGFFRGILYVIPPVIINRDATAAWLYLGKAPKDKLPTVNDIHNIVSNERVLPNVANEELDDQIELVRAGKQDRILISRGKPALDGWPEYVEATIKIEKRAGKVLEDGRIDFKERQSIREVHEGEQVGNFIEAQNKQNGYDIYGTELKSEYRVLGPRMGKNLERDPDNPSIVKSKVNGYLSVKPKEIDVNETLVIHSDIDYNTGNIDFFGNVEVQGGVQPGFTVSSFGSLTVHGVVDAANAFSSGPMFLKSGAIGKPGTRIESKSDIHTLYLRNAFVKAEGDVEIIDFSYNSTVQSNGSITCTAKKGVVAGGRYTAWKKIEVNIAGNVGSETYFASGVDHHLNEKIDTLKKELANIEERGLNIREKINKAFSPLFLRNPKAFIEKMEEKKRATAIKVLQELSRISKQSATIQEQIHTLETKGPAHEFTPAVIILQKKNEGVKVEFPFGGEERVTPAGSADPKKK